MPDIETLPHHFDRKSRECRAIIETPRGARNKFKYERDSGLFTLAHVLPEGFLFPFDFGFFPSTAAADGDALDALVLMDEPAHVGCMVRVRLLGVVEVIQEEDGEKTPNDRLIAAALNSFAYREAQTVSDLRKTQVEQIAEFLGLYGKNSGKQVEVKGVAGPDKAVQLMEEAIAAFEREAR